MKDTTDHEKLIGTSEYKQFCSIIEIVMVTFENLRYNDKKPAEKSLSELHDLITPVSATPLVLKVESAVNSEKFTEEIIEIVRDYLAENEKTLNKLNDALYIMRQQHL